MDTKTYPAITALVFLAVFALHLLRLLYGWHAQIGSVEVPMWVSWFAMIASGFLSAIGFKLSNKK